jgi:hypothetical protein
LAQHYVRLTPEERFRLILAAGGRGDDAEQDRLCKTAQRISLGMPDYAPWSHAYDELATMVFMEVLEEAAKHDDAFHRWCEADEVWSSEPAMDEGAAEDDRESIEAGAEDVGEDDDEPADGSAPADEGGSWSTPTRARDLYLAQGFILKTKAAGWTMFCERLSIPPFGLWQLFPGYDRLRRALDLLEDDEFRPAPAFRPEGMLRWLGTVRREGAPEPSLEGLISPEGFAADLDLTLRERVAWWRG